MRVDCDRHPPFRAPRVQPRRKGRSRRVALLRFDSPTSQESPARADGATGFGAWRRLAIASALLALIGGCASMHNMQPAPVDPQPAQETKEIIKLVSDPLGVLVNSSTGDSCTTPCEIEVDWNDEFLLSFEAKGFHERVIKVRQVPADRFDKRSMAVYALTGAFSGFLYFSLAEVFAKAIVNIATLGLLGADLDEQSLSGKSRFVIGGAVAGLVIGTTVRGMVREHRRLRREEVWVKLKPQIASNKKRR